MTHRLINALKRHAAELDGVEQQPRFATVVSYNPSTNRVKVRLDFPGDPVDAASPPVTSGWLPIVSPMTGSAWGVVSPIAPGQQVVIVPESGDPSSWIVMGAVYSTANVPPQPPASIGGSASPVQVGELALVNQGGAVFRLCSDGSIYCEVDGAGYSLEFNAGQWLVQNTGGTVSLQLGSSIIATVQDTTLTIESGQIKCNAGSGTMKPVMVQGGGVSNVLFATS